MLHTAHTRLSWNCNDHRKHLSLTAGCTCGRSSRMGSIRSMLAKVTLRCFSSLRGAQSPHPALGPGLVNTPATSATIIL